MAFPPRLLDPAAGGLDRVGAGPAGEPADPARATGPAVRGRGAAIKGRREPGHVPEQDAGAPAPAGTADAAAAVPRVGAGAYGRGEQSRDQQTLHACHSEHGVAWE